VDPSSAVLVSVLADAIYLVDPATGDRVPLVTGLGDFRSGYAVWSPDHRSVLYADGGIWVVEAATGARRRLAEGQGLSTPAPSGDGERVAYRDGTAVWVLRPRTGRVRPLPLPRELAPLGLAWGPDGTLAFGGLALRCDRFGTCVSTERSEIYVVRPDGSGLRRLTRAGHAERPKWSPDGGRLLFVRRPLDRTGAGGELWVVRADGRGARRVGGLEDVVAADWSPDGGRMVIVRRDTPGTLQVLVAAADGSRARPLGEPLAGADATVDW
jgi:Tol biopolymer transport system component